MNRQRAIIKAGGHEPLSPPRGLLLEILPRSIFCWPFRRFPRDDVFDGGVIERTGGAQGGGLSSSRWAGLFFETPLIDTFMVSSIL